MAIEDDVKAQLEWMLDEQGITCPVFASSTAVVDGDGAWDYQDDAASLPAGTYRYIVVSPSANSESDAFIWAVNVYQGAGDAALVEIFKSYGIDHGGGPYADPYYLWPDFNAHPTGGTAAQTAVFAGFKVI